MLETIKWLFGLAATKEENGEGYIPGPLMRMMAVDSKTDYKPGEWKKYTGFLKILVVCTEQRYFEMTNGAKFSSGNHPVETIHPMRHLMDAGFEVDVATPTGKPVCLEEWALPMKDEAFLKIYEEVFKPKFEKPLSLASISLDSYACMFVPGGQGAMLGIPDDVNVGKATKFFHDKDRYIMSVCHSPAFLLAGEKELYSGYKIACFPDSLDKITHHMGYLPGPQPWFYGEKLKERGIEIMNTGADGTVIVDRKLITGASPKACEELGRTMAEKLVEEYA